MILCSIAVNIEFNKFYDVTQDVSFILCENMAQQ